jgi:hypothetical protein
MLGGTGAAETGRTGFPFGTGRSNTVGSFKTAVATAHPGLDNK